MPVNPARTMLLIAAWPDNLVAPELIVWGIGRRLRRIQWYSRRVTECAYNAAVKELARRGGPLRARASLRARAWP
jgi:hypothetical protein